jgi:hypothetical protein
MSHHQVMNSYNQVCKLDFTQIRMKLADREHGSNWTESKIHEAELLYIAYLSIIHAFPDSKDVFAPPELADEFWHQHILDTRKYMADCITLFGEYLHHFPYFGMRGSEDAKALDQATIQMKNLLATYFFNLPRYKEVLAHFTSSDCSNCSGACSSCSDSISVLPSKLKPVLIAI